MTKKRRQYSPEFKFKVALEAAKGTKTISELASQTEVHPNQVSEASQGSPDARAAQRGRSAAADAEQPPVAHVAA